MVRRRLNSVAAQHSAYLSLSVLLLVSTLIIISGLLSSAVAFRIATWGGTAVSIGVIAGAVVLARRRWLDLQATAQLIDRRGQLTDRLTTLVDLRTRPRASRLAPVLVAQTLALGARWQAQRIAPRRVPRSVFVLLASLLALVSTVLIARRTPPPPASEESDAATSLASQTLDHPASLKAPQRAAGGARGENSGPGNASLTSGSAPPHGEPDTATAAKLRAGQSPPEGSLPELDGSQPSLSERLQEAIRRAFHAEAMDRPHDLAAKPAAGSDNPDHRRDSSQGEHDGQGRNPSEKGKPGAQPQSAQQGAASAQQRQAGGTNPGQSKGEQVAQRQDGSVPDQHRDGAAPAAGDGSSPGGLMAAKPDGTAAGPESPKTYKLTISSFLHSIDQKSTQPRQQGKRPGTAAAETGSTAQAALSERQLNDDALRKAEIPPEYEDLVRRVYSVRADQ